MCACLHVKQLRADVHRAALPGEVLIAKIERAELSLRIL